ncbi:MAG: hypothetical protein ACXVAM_16330, partial [Vulcanimicrobiaceae bacterium]
FPTGVVTQHEDAVNGEPSCSSWEAIVFSPSDFGEWSAYPMSTAKGTVWYGGAFLIVQNATFRNVGIEEWGYDPHIDNACPTPTPNPQPTPGPGACDPVYNLWP